MWYAQTMKRKNLSMSDELSVAVGKIRHDALFSSETAAINALLEGASEQVNDNSGYVYLMSNEKTGLLKIGYSQDPDRRVMQVSADEKADVFILYCLSGTRLLEICAHSLWRRFHEKKEWFVDCSEIRNWFEGHDLRVMEWSRRNQNSIRTDQIRVILSDSEKSTIEFAAKEEGIPAATWARKELLRAAREALPVKAGGK